MIDVAAEVESVVKVMVMLEVELLGMVMLMEMTSQQWWRKW